MPSYYQLTYDIFRQSPHFFCGTDRRHGLDCPNCALPLTRYADFDLSDDRLDIKGLPISHLPLYFCWQCPLKDGFSYCFDLQGVRILHYRRGERDIDFPYEKYPRTFPQAFLHLETLDPGAQHALERRYRAHVCELPIDEADGHGDSAGQPSRPLHLVNCIPFIYNADIDPPCVICGLETRFFAAFADDNLDQRGFTGNIGVSVLFNICERCSVVMAYHDSD